MSPTPVQLANLKPNPGGEVRNPLGHNQYTYRDDAKRKFAALCVKHAADFLETVFKEARHGETWAAKMVWDEIMPAIKTIDLNVSDERDPVKVPTTDARLGAVAELLQETLH